MKEFIDKLIKKLKQLPHAKDDMWIWLVDAEVTIRELAEEYNNGWIPCSERLPEEYGEYLCCDKYGNYIIGYPTARVSSDDYYVETENEIMNDCIAWKPLPPAYKEEGGEDG